MVFTLIVTRQLSEEEFGTWNLIGSLMGYVMIETIFSYWIVRETARGLYTAKTGIISSGIFSVGAIVAYLVIIFLISDPSGADINALYFAAILIPVTFINKTLVGINLGSKPHALGYGVLVFEIVKIPVAFLFVYYFQLEVEGAIIASVIAYLASIAILFYYAREKILGYFKKEYLKKWLKLSWLPLYKDLPNTLFLSDVVIFSLFTGSVVGIAYMTVARAISNTIAQTAAFTKAVYPKLVAGGKDEFLQENLIRFFFFAFPFLSMSITFAKPGLWALNPVYEIMVPIVAITSIRAFITTLSKIFYTSIQGREDVDFMDKSTFKDYVKSRLFLVPTLRFIQYGAYVGLLVTVLILFVNTETSLLESVSYWAWVSLIMEIPFFILYVSLVNKNFKIKIDYSSLIKYAFASLATFIPVYYLMEEFLEYRESIFEFLPAVICYLILAMIVYLSITYMIDNRTKKLFKLVLEEFKYKRMKL
jgi:hypothetical protein